MVDDNKRNLLYFENKSMKGLYDAMEEWQVNNAKRLLSTNIQIDDGKYCCIANPTEVIICDGDGTGNRVKVGCSGQLYVT